MGIRELGKKQKNQKETLLSQLNFFLLKGRMKDYEA